MSRAALGDAGASRVGQIVGAVRRRIGDVRRGLPEEPRPAHLSVALIDAVFNPQVNYCKVVVPIVNRYCRCFKKDRMWEQQEWPPPIEGQETLSDLVGHYDRFGLDYMRWKAFESGLYSPGTHNPGPPVYKSDNVLHCARALHAIEVDTLQDLLKKDPGEIKRALCAVRGIGERTAHMLLMFCGHDEYVKGDVHICRFVSNALGVDSVSAREAERLVAGAARALGITPRSLDARIWNLGAGVG